jgi:hypothetical protein
MRSLFAVVVVLVVALVAAAGAAAGNPFQFSDRAAFERSMLASPRPALPVVGRRYVPRSIGCAKAGVGRYACVLVATSRLGTQTYSVRVSCSSDTSNDCRLVSRVLR